VAYASLLFGEVELMETASPSIHLTLAIPSLLFGEVELMETNLSSSVGAPQVGVASLRRSGINGNVFVPLLAEIVLYGRFSSEKWN